jgi:hypothetical protein
MKRNIEVKEKSPTTSGRWKWPGLKEKKEVSYGNSKAE